LLLGEKFLMREEVWRREGYQQLVFQNYLADFHVKLTLGPPLTWKFHVEAMCHFVVKGQA